MKRFFLLSTLAALTAGAGGHPVRGQAPAFDYVRFVLDGENGYVDIAAMDLPEDYLARVADRSLRLHFRTLFRPVESSPSRPSDTSAPATADRAPGIRVVHAAPSPGTLVRWKTFPDGVPRLRGFRAPMADGAEAPITAGLGAHGEYRRAAEFVARNLALEGLIKTSTELLRRFALPWVSGEGLDRSTLRSVGLPVDLLSFFSVDGQPLDAVLATWWQSGGDTERARQIAGSAVFEFVPSLPGFVVTAEDGGEPIGALRTQLATHRFIHGENDGSSLDVFRQLIEGDHGADLRVAIETARLPALLGEIRSWGAPAVPHVTVFGTPFPVTRWGQDNGKAGLVHGAAGAPTRVVTLVPRFASINEQSPKFVAGDSFVFRPLAQAGEEFVHSPLLFQGGDMIPLVHPASGERWLLIGEAELQRNRGLGLSREQGREGLRREFGVDRIEVLPNVSYHLDLEVTVRRSGTELVALVLDEVAAARIIVDTGIRALARGGLVTSSEETALLEAARRQDVLPLVGELWQRLNRLRDGKGRFNRELISCFADSEAESAEGNALRFLLAVDILTAAGLTPEQLDRAPQPARMKNYLRSMQRRAADRAMLAERLVRLGFRVHAIPGFSDEEASINYVNGVHLPGRYLMPVFGEFFSPLNRAARETIGEALGPGVTIDAIRSGALQARYGGIHCVLSVYPQL